MSYLSYLFRTFLQDIGSFFTIRIHSLKEEYRYQSEVFEIRKGYGSILKSLFYSRLFKASVQLLGVLLVAGFLLVQGGGFLVGKLKGISAVSVVEAKGAFPKTETPQDSVAFVAAPVKEEVLKPALVETAKPEVEPKQTVANPPLPIVPPEERYIILVDKKNKVLKLAEFLDGSYKVIERFTVSIGEIMGNKRFEGDLRTPEGSYRIVEIKLDEELHPQYGPFAFVLNYPNDHDRALGKTGNGIWIHGSGSNTRSPETKGCVELGNADLVRLRNYISENTPVYIFPEDSIGIQDERIDLAAIDTLRKHLDTL